MEADLLTLIGLAGFVAYLAGYGLVQLGGLDGNGTIYTLLNLAGASLVLISLFGAFNLASALIQVTWIVVSLVGIARQVSKRVLPHSPNRKWRGRITRACSAGIALVAIALLASSPAAASSETAPGASTAPPPVSVPWLRLHR